MIVEHTQSGKTAFRNCVKQRLLPSLRAFNPDLIIISAGFDAGHGDLGNYRNMEGSGWKVGSRTWVVSAV